MQVEDAFVGVALDQDAFSRHPACCIASVTRMCLRMISTVACYSVQRQVVTELPAKLVQWISLVVNPLQVKNTSLALHIFE